jgi:hypothetical protein
MKTVTLMNSAIPSFALIPMPITLFHQAPVSHAHNSVPWNTCQYVVVMVKLTVTAAWL